MFMLFVIIMVAVVAVVLEKRMRSGKNRDIDYRGQLSVVGRDSIEIEVHKQPQKVVVHFIDEQVLMPCSPNVEDQLWWEMVKKKNCHFLLIHWNVGGERKISWLLDF
jgi:hypothetical protein